MLTYAIIFLIISLVAGAIGLTNVSVVTKRISMILFALFLLMALAVVLFVYLVSGALSPSPSPAPAPKALIELRPVTPA